jgi:hypothetical protein
MQGSQGAPPAANSVQELKGRRWVVLTGLVPIEKQSQAFFNAFRHAVGYDASRDQPVYFNYQVERAEVADPAEASTVDWKKAQPLWFMREVNKAQGEWSATGMGTDVVNPQFLDQRLTFPLGPLQGRTWSDQKLAGSLAHEPEIPVAAPGYPGGGQMGNGGTPAPAPGPVSAKNGAEGDKGSEGEDPSETPGTGPGTPGGQVSPPPAAVDNKPLEYRLLRFFDFHVEPGRHYVYRVKLRLLNPNYIPDPKAEEVAVTTLKLYQLKDASLAKSKYVDTDWSEPSPVVATPHDTRVLAVSVTPKQSRVDPIGTVMVAKWMQRKGFEAFDDLMVCRGQLINMADKVFTPGNGSATPPGGQGRPGPGGRGGPIGPGGGGIPGGRPIAPGGGTWPGGRPGPGGGGGGAWPGGGPVAPPRMPPAGGVPPGGLLSQPFKLNYLSYVLAVDFRGGQDVTGRRGRENPIHAPGEILLMDRDGNLEVRDELDDKPERDALKWAQGIVDAAPAVGPLMPAGKPPPALPPRGRNRGTPTQPGRRPQPGNH